MNAGRARMMSATVLGLGLLIPLSFVPAAAATCALSVPATGQVGTPLAIVGSGFPASSSLDISIGLEGATPDQFAVQSDGAGAFQISLTPEPADAGKTTVVATAGTTCSAQAVFTVTGATSTPDATPDATPTAKPTATRSANPNPSSPPRGAAAGSTDAPPQTDIATTSAGRMTDNPAISWAFAVLMILIGISGLLITRRTVGR